MSHQTGVTHSSEGLKNVSHGAYDIYGYLDPRRLIFSSLLTYVLALRSFSLSKQRSSIFSPLIQINYTILNPLSCPVNVSAKHLFFPSSGHSFFLNGNDFIFSTGVGLLKETTFILILLEISVDI